MHQPRVVRRLLHPVASPAPEITETEGERPNMGVSLNFWETAKVLVGVRLVLTPGLPLPMAPLSAFLLPPLTLSSSSFHPTLGFQIHPLVVISQIFSSN